MKGKIAFPLLEGEKAALVIAADERQFKSPDNRPYADLAFVRVPSQDAVVVGNRSIGLERALNLPVQFVGVCDFGVAPNNHLRGEVKDSAGGCIRPFVERVLPKRLMLPRPLADTVAGGIGAGKRLFEGFGLRFGDDQFHLCGKFHGMVIVPNLLSQRQYLI